MNLARHAAVLWRFRAVTATGVAFGLLLALLASYRLVYDGGISLVPRGKETWSATSSLLVTQPGFPEGRVTLPQQQVATGVTTTGQAAVDPGRHAPSDEVQFADPGRLAGLADLYSKFLTSDQVLRRVPGHPTPDRVTASPFQASSAGQVLPVVQLVTMATSRAASLRMSRDTVKALRTVLGEGQRANQISRAARVEVEVFNAPKSVLTSGRKPTASILVLFLCLLATVAVTHLLQALRSRREAPEFTPFLTWDENAEAAEAEEPEPEREAPVASGAPRRLRQ
jgi:hypothetical protein